MEPNPYESPQIAEMTAHNEKVPLRKPFADTVMLLVFAAIAYTVFMLPGWIRIWLLGW
jgi:hypothetical protein